MNNKINEINRLNFEDILWIIFIGLSFLNIISNNFFKKYVVSGEQHYENTANNVSIFVLIILFFVYLYFFNRNLGMYNDKGIDATKEDFIKVFGSLLFVIGILYLLYFQINSDDNFIGGLVI